MALKHHSFILLIFIINCIMKVGYSDFSRVVKILHVLTVPVLQATIWLRMM